MHVAGLTAQRDAPGPLPLQRSVNALAEEWLAEHYPNGTNIRVSLLFPGNVKTNIIRNTCLVLCPCQGGRRRACAAPLQPALEPLPGSPARASQSWRNLAWPPCRRVPQLNGGDCGGGGVQLRKH